MLKFDPHLLDHAAGLAGGAAGLGLSLGVTTQLDGGPLDAAHIAGYAISLVIGLAPIVARRLLAGGSAGDRTRAAQKRAKAAKLPEGDARRAQLEEEADELEADAAAKEAIGKG